MNPSSSRRHSGCTAALPISRSGRVFLDLRRNPQRISRAVACLPCLLGVPPAGFSPGYSGSRPCHARVCRGQFPFPKTRRSVQVDVAKERAIPTPPCGVRSGVSRYSHSRVPALDMLAISRRNRLSRSSCQYESMTAGQAVPKPSEMSPRKTMAVPSIGSSWAHPAGGWQHCLSEPVRLAENCARNTLSSSNCATHLPHPLSAQD